MLTLQSFMFIHVNTNQIVKVDILYFKIYWLHKLDIMSYSHGSQRRIKQTIVVGIK